MTEPYWLSLRILHHVHQLQIERFGGAPGVRDETLLASALARPVNMYLYGDPEVFDLAAAYAAGLMRDHPFVDGNKRTGLVASALFLERNGYDLAAPEVEAVVNTLGLAAGDISDSGYAAWLRTNAARRGR